MGKRRLRGIIERIEPLSGSGPRVEKCDLGGPDIVVRGTEIAPSKPAHVRKAERDAIRAYNRKQILRLLPNQAIVPEYAKPKPEPKPQGLPLGSDHTITITTPPKPWRRV